MKQINLYDKLINLVAGIVNKRDKTSYNKNSIGMQAANDELLALYKDNWVAAKAVDIFAEDMVRKWRIYKGDREQIKTFIEEEKRLQLKVATADAIRWARLFGGAALIPIFFGDTDETMTKPLQIDKIKKGSLNKIIIVDRTLLSSSGLIQMDPTQDNYCQPSSYALNGSSRNIHHSRVLKFHGVNLPYQAHKNNGYWGDSALQRMLESINNASTTFNSVAQMMMEMITDVIKIPQLSSMLAGPEETDKMIERFNLMKLLSSVSQIKLLDKEEDWERHQIQLAGVNDIITQQLTMVSAAASIPVTRFIGTSPRGMNATGESDLEIHYENVHSKQETEVRPILDVLDKIIQMSLFGSLIEEFAYEFLPLYMQDGLEDAQTIKTNAEARQAYNTMGVLPLKTIAQRLVDEGWTIDPAHISDLENLDKATLERLVNPPKPLVNEKQPVDNKKPVDKVIKS
jgi:phage-related protein (TIGR01555 family)